MPFEQHYIEPLRPTALEDRCEFVHYPWTPGPLDPVRLRTSLAQTLQLFPAHAGTVIRNPKSGSWEIRLLNQAVRLSIGTTTHGGPFATGWKGERHPDYFDELVRANVSDSANTPLFQAKVTTWEATGQTAIMISQSYVLGDAFTIGAFTHCWSDLYQGKQPRMKPTFEKYFLPEIHVPPRATHSDLSLISWMAADFDAEYHAAQIEKMEDETERLDLTFSGEFVDCVFIESKKSATTKISRNDAFAGYLISTLQQCLDEPVQYAHQLVTLRGREMKINGESVSLGGTTIGNAYMIWGFPLEAKRDATTSSIANTMYQYRRAAADPARLGHIYTQYNLFYEKAVSRDRIFIDSGYRDGIAINWLVNTGLNDADWGFEHGGHIEWESLENFFQVWRANPVRQEDSSWWTDCNGLQVLCRVRGPYVKGFLDKIAADMRGLGHQRRPDAARI